jgi:HYR domain-containing protein
MKRFIARSCLLLGLAFMLISFAILLSTSASNANGSLASRTGESPLPAGATQAVPSTTFNVTDNGDMGPGTLRNAIDQANLSPGADMITFASSLPTINVGNSTGLPLPSITEAVTIDGGSPRVELNGTAAGPGANGITISAPGVTIRRLVINRFSSTGIAIQGDNCTIQDNFIGTDATGTLALPNAEGGVLVDTSGNLIGGSSVTQRNLISGNSGYGLNLNSGLATNNTIQGNFIGTDVSGTATLGNGGAGIRTQGSPSNNTIGSTVAAAGNIIAFNGGSGVNLLGGSSNAVLGNSMFENGGPGINLSDDPGITPNDPCDGDGGANALQNFPVLTSATSSVGSTTIAGTLDSTTSTTFRIEFFSSPACDDGIPNGEGKTFIGATTVNTPLIDCVISFNPTFPVGVPVGSVITATATDQLNNTSEFSQCVTVATGPGCTIFCPPDLIAFTSPTATACGTQVAYSVETSGGCTAIVCSPPSGAIFVVGTTSVTCTTIGGASCSFSITVVDANPPAISCPTAVSTTLPPGRSSAVVNYPAPIATDECAVNVLCVPPSGSTFPAGSTLVTCTATDASNNGTNCFFLLTLFDAEAPVIVCPPNVNAPLPAGQNSVVVNYPPPTVTDNFPGASFACSPASGSAFPAGSTTVTCTATDADRNRSTCSFLVSVGGPQAKITLPGNQSSLEFTGVPKRKPPKPRNNPCSSFAVENTGSAPLILTLDSIARTGTSVDSGRITDPNDTRFFSVSLVNADQSLTPLDIGAVLTLQPGQVRNLCAKFVALIPALAGKTTGLAASNVLPDTVTSRIVFRQNAGANISIPLLARVSTGVVLVNVSNPRAAPEVLFTASGNEITVSYGVFDSNLDVSRAKYEFLDSGGQVLAGPFEIDLTASINSASLLRGQSFAVDQRFTGASSNPEITSVRLTVFDGETSIGAPTVSSMTPAGIASVQLMNRARRVTLYLPDVKLR